MNISQIGESGLRGSKDPAVAVGLDRYPHIVWSAKNKKRKVIKEDTAKSLKKMMAATIEKGTARRGFRRLKRSLKEILHLGGKTGSITGGLPYGKRDWFVSFAKPKNNEAAPGISLCVMNVNIKKWRVKSTRMAKEIIQYYYTHVNPLI